MADTKIDNDVLDVLVRSSCNANQRGLAGLKVRHWQCVACGSQHDRDQNAAINALNAAPGIGVERQAIAA